TASFRIFRRPETLRLIVEGPGTCLEAAHEVFDERRVDLFEVMRAEERSERLLNDCALVDRGLLTQAHFDERPRACDVIGEGLGLGASPPVDRRAELPEKRERPIPCRDADGLPLPLPSAGPGHDNVEVGAAALAVESEAGT